jgi:DNA polymerase elongation subunit (family B)
MNTKILSFDIETIGEDFDLMDECTQEMLTRWVKMESKSEEEERVGIQEVKDGLGFSPLTGEIVAIGIYDVLADTGGVYYQNPENPNEDIQEGPIRYRAMSEKNILEKFWEITKMAKEMVSFNGRGFDVPFIEARSMVHEVQPTINLMPPRFNEGVHIDLMDRLSHYGTVRKKGSLHLWCRSLNIPSPKANGVDGDDVKGLFKEKRYLDIARYNVDDIKATAALYKKWDKFLRFKKVWN